VNTILDSNLFVYSSGYAKYNGDFSNLFVVPVRQTNNSGDIGNLSKMEEAIKEGSN
jgi:hypothetical protein